MSLPRSLGCRKSRQSTRALQPDFPKDGSVANQHSSKKGTCMSAAHRAEQDAQPLCWCVPCMAYRPGRVPASSCRHCWADLLHPTSLPKVNMGAEGIQQTRHLCGDFFAGRGQNHFPQFQTFKVETSLPRFVRPGVPPRGQQHTKKKKHSNHT